MALTSEPETAEQTLGNVGFDRGGPWKRESKFMTNDRKGDVRRANIGDKWSLCVSSDIYFFV